MSTDLNGSAPAYDFEAVTPSDSTVLDFRSLYVGTTGDVAVVSRHGNAVTFKNVPVGVLPVQGTKVKSTGTTASNIVALK